MASISGRVEEANKHLENGHKYMKTGLLKWAPDHDNAANQYMQAAMAFKGAGLHQKAIEANELAVKCYLATQNTFQAAKCLEQAALSSKEIGDINSVSKFYMRAIDIYRTTGRLDTAVSVIERAAKTLADKMPSLAADLYIQASEACAIEDRYRQAAEFCGQAANLYVKEKNYSRAANFLKEEMNCYQQAGDTRTFNNITMSLILTYLADKNIVGAYDALKTCQIDGEAYGLAQNLTNGFDKKDARLLNSVLNNPFFRSLNNEYAKLARDILNTYGKVEETSQPAGTSGKNPDLPDQDDDLLL